jgi:nucleoside-diphosphate-sugar epimerase
VVPAFHSLLGSTLNLLAAVDELGCGRVVLTGSLTEPRSSGDEVVPSSPYAAAKWASTAYARMFHALYGTPVVIVRPFMAYGRARTREARSARDPFALRGARRSSRAGAGRPTGSTSTT